MKVRLAFYIFSFARSLRIFLVETDYEFKLTDKLALTATTAKGKSEIKRQRPSPFFSHQNNHHCMNACPLKTVTQPFFDNQNNSWTNAERIERLCVQSC